MDWCRNHILHFYFLSWKSKICKNGLKVSSPFSLLAMESNVTIDTMIGQFYLENVVQQGNKRVDDGNILNEKEWE
jgi:hypothetical protein